LTDMIHQRDDFKSETERLKSKVENQFREIEKLKLENRNARKSQYSTPGASGVPLSGAVG